MLVRFSILLKLIFEFQTKRLLNYDIVVNYINTPGVSFISDASSMAVAIDRMDRIGPTAKNYGTNGIVQKGECFQLKCLEIKQTLAPTNRQT